MQNPNALLTILGKMGQKSEVKFEKLYPKLYNIELWVTAYERIAPNPGNMTMGTDGETIDGTGMELIREIITELKTSRYKPTPVRRTYIPKANGKLRPLGIPSFRDKLLQTVVKLLLEAIYEPTFADQSHGFRPERSCHTALEQVKAMTGVRWWVEGDIKGFFDNLNHDTLLRILSKRITDRRFLHLIEQFLKAGYVEDWQYHQTYSGTPQGGNLSPLLANIYLNELDQKIAQKVTEFNRGKRRRNRQEYENICQRKKRARRRAQRTGNWETYKALRKLTLQTQATDPQDPNFRRLYYVRYADDFLLGIIGSKADATALKSWLANYLRDELQLELSEEKTLITNAQERVRFLGYDIKHWSGKKILRYPTRTGVRTRRTCHHQLALLIPRDKCHTFAKEYGDPMGWKGKCRSKLINLSELEILMRYNAEVRGFLNYYALADNFSDVASSLLWLTATSFFKTLAGKRKSSVMKVLKSLKRGPARYVVPLRDKEGNTVREYELVVSTRQIPRRKTTRADLDQQPFLWKYQSRTELGQRLLANQCEWCGTQEGEMQVHHVRKLADLKGKTVWEYWMIERRRKTLVLCKHCHTELHAGRLSEKTRAK